MNSDGLNPLYGMYYSADGERLQTDQEAVDYNGYYGGTTENANTGYQS